MDDLVFTFNSIPFLNGINKIAGGFRLLKSAATGFFEGAKQGWNDFFSKTKKDSDKTQKSMVTNFGDNANSIVGALTKRVALLGASFLSLRKIISSIPEIGRSFKIAGDILMRNLFWPLRKLLMPMLQKMLDWVRDHRAMFVRWGVHIANAFRAVVNIVKGLISLVKNFVQSFINRFEAIFGKVTKRMGDIVNIIMFKITAVTEFLIILLEPVMKRLGDLFAIAFAGAKKFFDGFMSGIGNVTVPLMDMAKSLSRLLDLFVKSDKATGSLFRTLKALGTFIGGALRITIEGFAQLIDTVVTSIQGLVEVVSMLKGARQGFTPKQIEEQKKRFQELWKGYKERSLERGSGIKTTVIGKGASLSPISSSIKIGDMNINIKTEGDAKKVGQQFAQGIHDTLYKKLNQNINDALLGVSTPA